MKKILLACAGLGAAFAQADTGSANNGFVMNSWPSADHHGLTLTTGNPAMGSMVIGKKDSYRMSLLPTFQFGTEFGQVDNLEEDLEYLTDILDDPDSAQESASDVLDRFDDILDLMGREGYVNIGASGSLPFTPFYFNSDTLNGTVGFSAEANVIGGFRVLDDALTYDDVQGTFNTSTSLYLKGAVEQSIAANYSRIAYQNNHGKLYAGAKLKLLSIELSKQVLPLLYIDGDDIADIVVDEYDNNSISSSGVAVDLGLIWDAPNYRLGFTMNNINEPEFDFGTVGVNCDQITNVDSQNNCQVAKYFAEQKGEINPSEVYVKQATAVVDAMYKITGNWNVSAAADLLQYTDAIGNPHRWLHLGLNYSTSSMVPSLRLGYHANSIGNETSSVTIGTTLFRYVNFDLEYGLESVESDGSKVPRRIGFGFSIQQAF